MSIRAFKIVEIKYKKDETFNLWHDENLMDFLDRKGIYETLTEGSGITEIAVKDLEEAVEKNKVTNLSPKTEKAIKKDIAWAKKRGEDYIQYYCY